MTRTYLRNPRQKIAWYKGVLILVLFFLSPVLTVQAAPYGLDKIGGTVYDRLYESDVVVYGKIIQKTKSKDRGDLTEIEVYDGIKGGKWKKGDYLYVNEIVKQPDKTTGVIYLFIAEKGGHDFYEVNVFYPDKGGEIYRYTKSIHQFMMKKDDESRVRWLYSRVNSPVDFIAWDSFAQLAAAPYSSLKKAAPAIQKESLRYLIAHPKVQDNRKSFFAFLLGLSKSTEDVPLIKRLLDNPANQERQVIRGAMMAYGLLLKDHPAYFQRTIEQSSSDNKKIAVLDAVKNLMLYERPADPQALLKPLYWALQNGSSQVTLHAVKTSGELQLTGPIRHMRRIYFERYPSSTGMKTSIITYLKLVRRKSPDALKLLNEIKSKEKDPEILKRI